MTGFLSQVTQGNIGRPLFAYCLYEKLMHDKVV